MRYTDLPVLQENETKMALISSSQEPKLLKVCMLLLQQNPEKQRRFGSHLLLQQSSSITADRINARNMKEIGKGC
jgi:hypothetical protein